MFMLKRPLKYILAPRNRLRSLKNRMKENMFDVLIYLFENYAIDVESFEPGQDELAKELIGAGFQDEDVSQAFAWLESLLGVPEAGLGHASCQPKSLKSIRFYAKEEMAYLKSDGKFLLTRLVKAQLLDQLSHETVIDRVMALDSQHITVEHIKWVVLMVLRNQPDFSEIAEWAEVVVSDNYSHTLH